MRQKKRRRRKGLEGDGSIKEEFGQGEKNDVKDEQWKPKGGAAANCCSY